MLTTADTSAAVRKHYNAHSSDYDLKRASGYLSWLGKREHEAVLRAIGPVCGNTILDAGCGTGIYTAFLRARGANTYGVDISEGMIAVYMNRNFHGQVADIQSMKIKHQFDKAICIGVLEFCPDPAAALRSIFEHLKEGGKLILLYPHTSVLGRFYQLYHAFHHIQIRLFSNRDLETISSQNSLILCHIRKIHGFASLAVLRAY